MKDSEKFTKPFEIKKINDLSTNNQSRNNDDKNYTMFNENKEIKIPIFNDGVSNGDAKSTNYEKIKIKKSNKEINALKEI